MWTAVTPVLVVLVTAAVGIGSRPTRWRRRIGQDLDLLEKLTKVHPTAAGVADLQNRIDVDIWQYAVLEDEARARRAVHRRTLVRRMALRGGVVISVLTAVAGAAVLAGGVVGSLGGPSGEFEDIATAVTIVVSFVGTLAALGASERIARLRRRASRE